MRGRSLRAEVWGWGAAKDVGKGEEKEKEKNGKMTGTEGTKGGNECQSNKKNKRRLSDRCNGMREAVVIDVGKA